MAQFGVQEQKQSTQSSMKKEDVDEEAKRVAKDNDNSTKCAEGTSDTIAKNHNTSFTMPDGRQYRVDRPVHVHGYANINKLAARTPLDLGVRYASWRSWDGEREPQPTKTLEMAQQRFAHFISTFRHLQYFIWDSDLPPPLTVLNALQTCHPSVALCLEAHHFHRLCNRQAWEFELANASGSLVREITSNCIESKDGHHSSSAETIKLLRTLPNLRKIRYHVVHQTSRWNTAHEEFTDASNGTTRFQPKFDVMGRNFQLPLPDTGPARLETLVFSDSAGVGWPTPADTFLAVKNSLHLQYLRCLDLGRNAGSEVLQVFTGVNLLPNLQCLGLIGYASSPYYLSVFTEFVDSLPPLQQIKIRWRMHPDRVWQLIEHSCQTLRIFNCGEGNYMWNVAAARRLVTLCPALERLLVFVDQNTFVRSVEVPKIIAELPALKFCEMRHWGSEWSEEQIRQLWNTMIDAGTKQTGNSSLMGIKINDRNSKVCSSVVTRSERDDAGPYDVRIVHLRQHD